MHRRTKAYNFLLLELLIALSLFSLCILPLTSIPMKAVQSDLKTYQRLQLQRISDEAFAMVQAQLYQRQISWEQLNSSTSDRYCLFSELIPLNISSIGKRTIERSAYLYTVRGKEGKNSDQYRLVKVEIRLKSPNQKDFFLFKKKKRDSISFYYQLFVHQRSGLQEEKAPPHHPPSQKLPLTA